MKIRDLATADRAQWDALWRGYLDFYQTPLPAEVTDATFARLLDPAEPLFALVAAEGDTLLGLAHCVLHRATWSLGPHCYLEDLFVAPAARGAGVGRALIEAIYARADAMGCGRVHWLTQESNAEARRLYDRIGRSSGFIQYRRE